MYRLTHFALVFLWTCLASPAQTRKPNIVFIISDDQDLHLGSMNYMPSLQRDIVSHGLLSKSHYGTVSLCCPARATLFRGQAAHNTNITHVGGPGGGYAKFQRSGEMNDYLPLWLSKVGYTTAYIGKFMNGFNSRVKSPEGWDWLDLLVAPWIYSFNRVVMRQNEDKAVLYEGWHQTDVLRIKALNLIERFTSDDIGKPFYLEIAPASPHVRPGGWPTVPLARYMHHFPGTVAPRLPNWNPPDELHQGKPSWVGEMAQMNESVIKMSDASMRARLQGLQGLDEIVEDVVALLKRKGILDETYIFYTTDNGFHLGQHRVPGGKGLPYLSDVNLPFAVRGPGIPAGRVSSIPQTHVDVAPTLLDIAGLPRKDWPRFFDGRSLLDEWRGSNDAAAMRAVEDDGITREVINVEYWGSATAPAGKWTTRWQENSYKSLRLVSKDGKNGWLFNRWCTQNQTELYDTVADPYELANLALNPDVETKRLMDRLSGLLLVTKSCGQESCRKPWEVLAHAYHDGANLANPDQRSFETKFSTFRSLEQAMEARYDTFFSDLPVFGFQFCLPVQLSSNEGPFFPSESEDLGKKYREIFADEIFYTTNGTLPVDPEKLVLFGDVSQRYSSMEDVLLSARPLTEDEMGWEVELADEESWAEMDDD